MRAATYIGISMLGLIGAFMLATAVAHAVSDAFNQTAARIESQRSG